MFIGHDLNIIGNGHWGAILSGNNTGSLMFDIPASVDIFMKDFQMKNNISLAFFGSSGHTLENILFKGVDRGGNEPIGLDNLSNLKIDGEVKILPG